MRIWEEGYTLKVRATKWLTMLLNLYKAVLSIFFISLILVCFFRRCLKKAVPPKQNNVVTATSSDTGRKSQAHQ